MKVNKVKTAGGGAEEEQEETLMTELNRLVQETLTRSSWWERRGEDCCILGTAFLCLPSGRRRGHHEHRSSPVSWSGPVQTSVVCF